MYKINSNSRYVRSLGSLVLVSSRFVSKQEYTVPNCKFLRAGEVSWEEYHAYFLRSHGYLESYVNSHDKKHSDLSRTLKENIMRDRARWAEAARNDPDRLALDEFLAFTHPESSHRALLQMVEDLFEKFGKTVFRLSGILNRSSLVIYSSS